MGKSHSTMPSIVLTLSFFALTFSLAAGAACNASDYGVTAKVPCTTVPLCTSSAFGMATIGSQADGRGEFPARTTVKLCYDAQALHLHYEAKEVQAQAQAKAQAQAINDAAGADKQANKEAMAAAKKALKASKEVKKNKKESKAAIAKAQGQMVQAKQKGDWSKYKDDVVKVEQAKQKLDKLDGNAQIATNEANKTESIGREFYINKQLHIYFRFVTRLLKCEVI